MSTVVDDLVVNASALIAEVEMDKCREGHRRKCGVWDGRSCDCETGRIIVDLRIAIKKVSS